MKQALPQVLITRKFPDDIIKPLEQVAQVYQWDRDPWELMPRSEVMKLIPGMTAVINQAELTVDEALLNQGKRLRIVANVSIGVDNLDLKHMTERRVWASNTPGYFDYPVAEYVMGGIITILRRLLDADRFVKNGEWQTFQPGRWDGDGLRDKTLGIIGMGSIGQSLARLGSALGMKVIYHSRSKATSEYAWVSLPELLKAADVVSVHVPYSEATHEMIGALEFATMKPGVLFVNTSRGKVVKEPDLVRFLETGHIGGAVLDVFAGEPAVPEPLRNMNNVLLSPHMAGGTRSGRIACYRMAVANVLAVLAGEPPLNPLNAIV